MPTGMKRPIKHLGAEDGTLICDGRFQNPTLGQRIAGRPDNYSIFDGWRDQTAGIFYRRSSRGCASPA
jgi:hypothetical protein